MDLREWLRSLGLGQYEATFRESEIDADILLELTDQDLEKLGVPLGHRKRLLKAIGTLKDHAAGAVSASPRPSTDTAERRHVTVMFSDLVGSTALSARMDPEDLREVISAYQKCVAETVQRFSGYVAKYMGDGVLIYFGYPQAHEDDAERAVRAGLELVTAVTALKTQATLQTVSALRPDWWCRRSDRLGRFSGTGYRRRDTEPCSTLAGRCGAEQRRDCRKYPQARGQPI